MKKTIKAVLTLTLIFCVSYLNVSILKADNSSAASINAEGSGRILTLNPGQKSGLILDEVTGAVKEFHYAGLEVLEINVDYIYLVQVTASGRIIIRDIHRR
jgi:hypothetical protein